MKNEERLLADDGPIDWRAAFDALDEIGYDGWYVLESRHPDRAHLLETTPKHVEFMRRHCRMPVG